MRSIWSLISTILLLILATGTSQERELNWENMLFSSLKLQKNIDYEKNADCYLQQFRKTLWNKYRNDEFELEARRKESITQLKNRIAAFDLNDEFVTYTDFNIGKYNFKKQSFPVSGLTQTTYFYQTVYAGCGDFARQYKVFFNNTNMIGDLNMPKEKAKQFIKYRKDSRGKISRKIYAKLYFKIVSLKGSPDNLMAKLTRVTLYDNHKRQRVLKEF